MHTALTIYDRLSGWKPLAKSYPLKFLFIAFMGIHIPLIGIIVYLLFGPQHLSPMTIFGLVLVLTLLATACTLYMLYGLLSPLQRSKQALENYLTNRTLPQLPEHHVDEAGVLMKKLQLSLATLNNLIEEKEDLASLLSHDLKQPLSVISTSAEALRQTSDPAMVARFAQNISCMATEQLRLLEDVLQLLRLNNIERDESFDTIPLEPFLMELLEHVKPQAGLKNITINYHPEYDGMAQLQPELFRQLLKNLLHNAIKFSHSGNHVALRVWQAGHHLCFSITDSGVGFMPEKSTRLFDRFTKEGKAGTAGEESTGIGLHICKRIVLMHSGTISAHSDGVGKGATFSITIPNDPANSFEEFVMQDKVLLKVA